MPDFSKLKARQPKAKVIEPEEIFRRLPKPPGINDLYQSQAEVLRAWYGRRDERDLVIKLHTGGGKTLVGLLIAQSTLNEKGEPVLYLTPTVQLMNQALAKAKEYGLPAVPYATGREPLPDAFTNGQAVLVATYNALFNGISKFGVSGTNDIPVAVGAILLDDAHASFSVIREQFTLTVDAKREAGLFGQLATMFRQAFQQVERVGTFDDVVAGAEHGVLEVPYWAWADKRDAVREMLKNRAEAYRYVWPFLRDRLGLCHAFVSSSGFTITPIVPPVEAIPTFAQAPRRIYMSATIADDSSIVRTFDAAAQAVEQPLMSKSLAGVSEIFRAIGDRRVESDVLGDRAAAIARSGHLERAICDHQEALNIAQDVSDKHVISKQWLGLAYAYHHLGNLAEARRSYQEGLALASPLTHYRCAILLGLLCLEEDQVLEAQEHGTHGIDLCRTLLDKTPRLVRPLYSLALAYLGTQQPHEALATYQRALEVCSAQGVVRDALQDLQLLRGSRVAWGCATLGIEISPMEEGFGGACSGTLAGVTPQALAFYLLKSIRYCIVIFNINLYIYGIYLNNQYFVT